MDDRRGIDAIRRLLVSFRPIEPGSIPENRRGIERDRRIVLTLGASVLSKSAQFLTSILLVRLLVEHLGVETYGVWATLASIIAMMGFLGRGVGDGLVHVVADTEGSRDPSATATAVSTTVAVMTLIGVTLLGVLALSYGWVRWERVLNISPELAGSDVGPAIAVLVVFFGFNSLVNVTSRIQYGLQLGHVAAVWQIVATATVLVCVVVGIRHGAGLPWFAFAMVGVPGLVNLVNGIVFFSARTEFRRLLPRPRLVSRKMALELVQVGGLYFLIQGAFAIAVHVDNLLTIHMLGASAVTAISVPMRLFNVANAINVTLVTVLWPSYKDAFARGDVAWVSGAMKRALKGSLGIGLLTGFSIVLFGRPFIHFWVDGAVAPSLTLLTGIAFLSLLMALGAPVSAALNAANHFKPQLRWATFVAVTAVGSKLALLSSAGIDVLPWAMAVSYGGLYLIPAYRFFGQTVLSPNRMDAKH